VAEEAPKLSAEEAGPRVAEAIQRGDYAQAVAITRQTALPKPTLDLAVGTLILDAIADENAATRPADSIDDGIGHLEAAALAGETDAASSLRGLFHTGLSTRGENVVLAPQPALEECWQGVEEGGGATAQVCLDLRRVARP
jgi:hypothetical protein